VKEEEAWHGAPEEVSSSVVQLVDAAHLGSSGARHSDAVATSKGAVSMARR
jgi:hypothetical protein